MWQMLLQKARAALESTRGGQRGQGMVEYALILVLIAVVVIVILHTVGQQVSNVFSNVSSGLGGH
jgi:pilus assembly protein Flp/PilA